MLRGCIAHAQPFFPSYSTRFLYHPFAFLFRSSFCRASPPKTSYNPLNSNPIDASSNQYQQIATGEGQTNLDVPEGEEFRGELLKFERVNAHLANERTWLAWMRTALSVLTCAFSFMSLQDQSSTSYTWMVVVFILGSLFVVSVLFTYLTGWLRYRKVKLILEKAYHELTPRFDRLGLSHQSKFLGALLILTALVYWSGVWA